MLLLKDGTKVLDVHVVDFFKCKTSLKIKVNSFKDNSIELLVDNNEGYTTELNFESDIKIEDIVHQALRIIGILLKNKTKQLNEQQKRSFRTAVFKAVEYAKVFKGKPTNNYSDTECQAEIFIGYSNTVAMQLKQKSVLAKEKEKALDSMFKGI